MLKDSITLMEAVCTSEMSAHFHVTTWRYIPEESKLHTRFLENLKSYIVNISLPGIPSQNNTADKYIL
jgi:hypothetical protein